MIDRGWKFYPALKTAIFFAAGIIIAKFAAPSPEQLLVVLYGALAWLVLAVRRERIGLAVPLIAVTVAAGALAYGLHARATAGEPEGQAMRDIELTGRVNREPAFRKGRVEFTVEPDSLVFRNSIAYPATLVLLRLYDSTPFDPALIPKYGDGISVVGAVQVPDAPVNPGEFDNAAYLRSRGIGLVMSVTRASSIHIVCHEDLTWLEHLVLPVRRAARQFCDRHVGGEQGDILRALLLGEREYIDQETRAAFTYTGTVHILAVSGFNVGLIALVLFVVASWIGNRWWQLLLFVPMLVLYTIVAGGEASIVRATVMAIVFMLARAAGRLSRPLNTLGVAALVILAAAPAQLFDIGFQLSFASVAGIIMLYVPAWEWIVEHLRVVRRYAPIRWTTGMVLLSLCAQLFTLPLVLYHFGFVSVVSLLVNLPVIPLTSVALGAGAAGTLAGTVSATLAAWFGGAAHAALALTVWFVQRGSEVRWGAVEIGSIGIIGATVLMAAALRLAIGRTTAQTMIRGATFMLATLCVLMADRAFDPLRRDGASYLCLLKEHRGMVAATVHEDTVRLYAAGMAADSTMLQFTGDAIRRRFGAAVALGVSLDSAGAYQREGELLMLGDRPREAVPHELPVILSYTGRRPLGLVDLFGRDFLQVPLRCELKGGLVLRYEGGWELVKWGD